MVFLADVNVVIVVIVINVVVMFLFILFCFVFVIVAVATVVGFLRYVAFVMITFFYLLCYCSVRLFVSICEGLTKKLHRIFFFFFL